MRDTVARFVGDKIGTWVTKQNKEVGEVLTVSGGRRFVVAEKMIAGISREIGSEDRYLAYGTYRLVEEGTGEWLDVRFEYGIGWGEVKAWDEERSK